MEDTFSQMVTLAGQMSIHVALAWWHRGGLSLAPALSRAGAQGSTGTSQLGLCSCSGASAPCRSSLGAQALLAPHGGRPKAVKPSLWPTLSPPARPSPLSGVGSSSVPPLCHQRGHQPALSPKMSQNVPASSPPSFPIRGVAAEVWDGASRAALSPQAWTHRDCWDKLKTRAET